MRMEFKSILVHGHCTVSSMKTFRKHWHIRKYMCGGMNSTNRTITQQLGRGWALKSWGEYQHCPFLPPPRAAQGSLSIDNLVPLSSQPILVTPTMSAHDPYSFFWTPTFQSAGWPSAFVHPPHLGLHTFPSLTLAGPCDPGREKAPVGCERTPSHCTATLLTQPLWYKAAHTSLSWNIALLEQTPLKAETVPYKSLSTWPGPPDRGYLIDNCSWLND